MRELRDDAVVLRTYKSGEADRIVVLWTRLHGKVRVIAKGARKTTSRLGATLETLACVNVDLVATRVQRHHVRTAARGLESVTSEAAPQVQDLVASAQRQSVVVRRQHQSNAIASGSDRFERMAS